MTRALWRRAGPWMTPPLATVEVSLVVSGLLTIRTAIVVGAVLEAAFWTTAISRATTAVRRYRSAHREGLDGWAAAEDGLAQLVPRPAARLLLIEPRLLACLARWASGRREGTSARAFSYHRDIRPLFGAILALVVVEGAVVDTLLAVLLPGTPWVWVALGVHLYALVWLAGFLTSMVTRPHQLDPDALIVRDGIFAELAIPYTSIQAARVAHQPNFGRSGLKVDPDTGGALLAVGDTNVAIDLDPARPVLRPGTACPLAIRSLRITVDEPASFVAALLPRVVQTDAGPVAGPGLRPRASSVTRHATPAPNTATCDYHASTN